ncbi:TBC1 domain family member 22A [Porphyridium purpureum]|uniref:TBC1 domain family member 22A n=1 Tax=Porphyridium purpureum TaxID=35688 RepID=A0A5J4YRK5_PORPP|nr:TBC1 domain family member 22A [Porphyridium purpureum]|eukprot:POR9604..scf222_8
MKSSLEGRSSAQETRQQRRSSRTCTTDVTDDLAAEVGSDGHRGALSDGSRKSVTAGALKADKVMPRHLGFVASQPESWDVLLATETRDILDLVSPSATDKETHATAQIRRDQKKKMKMIDGDNDDVLNFPPEQKGERREKTRADEKDLGDAVGTDTSTTCREAEEKIDIISMSELVYSRNKSEDHRKDDMGASGTAIPATTLWKRFKRAVSKQVGNSITARMMVGKNDGPPGAGASDTTAVQPMKEIDNNVHDENGPSPTSRGQVDPSRTMPDSIWALTERVEATHRKKLETALCRPFVSLDELQGLLWAGASFEQRASLWKFALQYVPCKASRRASVTQRKQQEYCAIRAETQTELLLLDKALKQIRKDLPRCLPNLPFLRGERVQALQTNVLLAWAKRHPLISYVQGMNDLLVPFLMAFGAECLSDADTRVDTQMGAFFETSDSSVAFEQSLESASARDRLESECYHCMGSLLDLFHNHYTTDQEGIQVQVLGLEQVLQFGDLELSTHLHSFDDLRTIQYAWRWIHGLFLRDFALPIAIRFWDALLSQDRAAASFPLYLGAAVLHNFRGEILALSSFERVLAFLQTGIGHHRKWLQVPTLLEEVLACAYLFSRQFPLDLP